MTIATATVTVTIAVAVMEREVVGPPLTKGGSEIGRSQESEKNNETQNEERPRDKSQGEKVELSDVTEGVSEPPPISLPVYVLFSGLHGLVL